MAAVTAPLERIDAGAPKVASAGPILVVDDIVKRFETPDGVLTAVDHVSLSVSPGEFVGVIGPSGCGKSTLFNGSAGCSRTTRRGQGRGRARARAACVDRHDLPEESTFPWRNVIDNVAFPLEIAGLPKSSATTGRGIRQARRLDGFERRYPAELSAACASACRWRARSRRSRRSC